MRHFLLAAAALTVLASGTAHATVMATASLYSPQAPSGTASTVVGIQSAPTGSATYTGTGYTISFANVGANEGIVQGNLGGYYAAPVAGVTGNNTPTYLTGDYGSAQTTSVAASGKYLSTGTGTITITFNAPETSLALLWGSIDTGNKITFLDGANGGAGDTLTGTQVQALASGFAGNGYQGAGGSAYVALTTTTAFTSVTFTSDLPSFEFAGVVASTAPFSVPEPASLALLGAGLVSVGVARRRREK